MNAVPSDLAPLLTYESGRGPRTAFLLDGKAFDVADRTGNEADASMAGLLEDWSCARQRVRRAAAAAPSNPAEGLAIDALRILAPVPRPGAIYGAGANYQDHAAEMSALAPVSGPQPSRSWHFLKGTHTVVGPGSTITLPPGDARTDWEVELAAVIGRRGTQVSEDEALDFVAGYTIAIDLSARGLSRRADYPGGSPFHIDWMAHKNFDGSCPMGPWLVPAETVGNPQRLRIGLSVNGETMQDSSTANMIFSIGQQISQLSERLTLWPGDVIMTGTPAGVGAGRNLFLKPGDRVVAHIDRLGELAVQFQ